MKIKYLILLLTMSICGISASAGNPQSKTDSSVEFRPHWDIQLQVGDAYTIGETPKFGKLLSPAAFLSTNYKFHHAMGVRFGVGGWQGKGAFLLRDVDYAFKFMQLNADYKLDISSLIGGFNHKRVCGVYAFVGAGLNYGFDNKAAAELAANSNDWALELEYLWDSKLFLAGRFGLGVDFRVGERLGINLELASNILSDKFNSKKAGNVDWQFNGLVGLSYRFGKNHQPSKAWLEQKAAEEAARVAAEKARIEAEKAKAAEAARLAAEKAEKERIAAEQAKVAAEKAAAEKKAAERAAIAKEHSAECTFLLGSSKIRNDQTKVLDSLAQWLNENADYNLLIVGHADKETGSPKINMELSQKRATAVQKYLLSKGVKNERITIDAKGDTEQPYAKPEKNRVALCIVK